MTLPETQAPPTFTDLSLTPSDKRRAAAILACALTGDRWGMSVGITEAQRADRIGSTVEAVAALVAAVPELNATAMVDRLRELAAHQQPVPKSTPRRTRKPPSGDLTGVMAAFGTWLASTGVERVGPGVQKLDR